MSIWNKKLHHLSIYFKPIDLKSRAKRPGLEAGALEVASWPGAEVIILGDELAVLLRAPCSSKVEHNEAMF